MNDIIFIKNKSTKGISIFEVMLTMFITLLTIHEFFNISLSSLSNIHINKNNLQAAILSQDITNRMQLNHIVARTTDSYAVDNFIANSNECKSFNEINHCNTQPCSSIEIANNDLSFWKNSINCRLKNTTVSIKYIDKNTVRKYELIFEFQNNAESNKTNKISVYKSI